MHFYPILLLIVIVAHDMGLRLYEWAGPSARHDTVAGPPPVAVIEFAGQQFSPAAVLALFFAALIALLAVLALILLRESRRLDAAITPTVCERAALRGELRGDSDATAMTTLMPGPDARRAVNRADRAMRVTRMVLLFVFAFAVLGLGWLRIVRETIGNLVLIDELVAMLPALFALATMWLMFYPMEMRIRRISAMRRMNMGLPVHAPPSGPLGACRYVFDQFRMHILMLLVPVLLILGIAEAIARAVERHGMPEAWPTWMVEAATLLAAVTVFVFAPLLMRMLLNVRVLRGGAVYDDLMEICRAHRVRLRGVLVWDTGGSMVNAAVMGLLAPVRYVLMTDALIEVMDRRQLKAVLAHEIGHVRRHHMPWLALSLIATLIALAMIAEVTFGLAARLNLISLTDPGMVPQIIGGSAILFGTLFVFGWISRRFERQADTFAVEHLSEHDAGYKRSEVSVPRPPKSPVVAEDGRAEDDGPSRGAVVQPHAVFAMSGALNTIAHVNGIEPNMPSWRHGSINWRRKYLHGLVGKPLQALGIHHVVARIKLAAILILCFTAGLEVWQSMTTVGDGNAVTSELVSDAGSEAAGVRGPGQDHLRDLGQNSEPRGQIPNADFCPRFSRLWLLTAVACWLCTVGGSDGRKLPSGPPAERTGGQNVASDRPASGKELNQSQASSPLPYTLMHGLGNTFIVVRASEFADLARTVQPAGIAASLCDQDNGIGADGVLVVKNLQTTNRKNSCPRLQLQIFNADGSHGEMCGNGLRCVGRFAVESGMVDANTNHLEVEITGTVIPLTVHRTDGAIAEIAVTAGRPRFGAEAVHADVSQLKQTDHGRWCVIVSDGGTEVPLDVSLVSMGNPHAVTFIEPGERFDLVRIGPLVERHPAFPRRINLQVATITDRNGMTLRTWERGCGLTRACASGACAAFAAASATEQFAPHIRHATITMPGGDLTVARNDDGTLTMTGPAENITTGLWREQGKT